MWERQTLWREPRLRPPVGVGTRAGTAARVHRVATTGHRARTSADDRLGGDGGDANRGHRHHVMLEGKERDIGSSSQACHTIPRLEAITFTIAWQWPRAARQWLRQSPRSAVAPHRDTSMTSKNSFGSRATLSVDGKQYTIFRLAALDTASGKQASRLPVSLKILLENLLRNEDDAFVKHDDILALAKWDVRSGMEKEIAFRTSRVLLQDFTGVPAVVD